MDHIKPALRLLPNESLKELSAEEFQKILNSWFEEKGIIKDLRAYVKYQMINVLKNTAIGKNITKTNIQELTLAKQALHLIVADYLIQNNCFYSLSIFSNEVNISNILPERSIFETHLQKPNVKFSMQNVVNILELVGISSNTEIYKEIVNTYFQSNSDNTLLSSLLNIVCKDKSKQNPSDHKEDALLLNDFLSNNESYKNLAEILSKVVTAKISYDVLNLIKSTVEDRNREIHEYYSKIISELNEALSNKEKHIQEFCKVKKFLEKKIIKTAEEHQRIRQKIHKYKQEKRVLKAQEENFQKENVQCGLKHCSSNCGTCLLKHCTDHCNKIKELVESYKNEADNLKSIVEKQKIEINKLNSKCQELIKEFSVCQSKINLLQTKMNEENRTQLSFLTSESQISVDHNQVHLQKNYSDSPPSITEEILREARIRLQQLEKESLDIDSRFREYLIT